MGLVGFGLPAWGQSVGLAVETPLGGYYRSGSWAPLSCTLTNQGPPADVKVVAQIQEYGPNPLTQTFEVSASLPSPANRRYSLYVRPPGFSGNRPLQVQLIQDRRIIAKQEPSLSALNDGDRLVAVITSQEGGFGVLAGTKLPASPSPPGGYPGARNQARVQVAYVKPELAPDRDIGYQLADLVVIGDLSSGPLTPAQEAALTRWVQAGGTLVVTGGDAAGLRSPGMQALLPVQVTGAAALDAGTAVRRLAAHPDLRVGGATSFAESHLPSGSFVAATSRPKAGATVVETAGRAPLLASWPVGAGRVLFLAIDPARPPFRGWDGFNGFWRQVILKPNPAVHYLSSIEEMSVSSGATGYYNGPGTQSSLANACLQVSQMDVPGFTFIGIFLVAYVVALVPLNYFVLKRRDRRELAWLTTPIIIVAFSGLAYLVGYGSKGGQVVLAQAGVVEAWAGRRTAPAVTYYGLFSPGKSIYDLSAAEGMIPLMPVEADAGSSRRNVRVVEGDSFGLKDVAIDMWDMGVFRGDSLLDLGQGVTAELTEANGALSGRITNQMPFDLEEVSLIGGRDRLAYWGALRRGESRTVRAAMTSSTGGALLPPAVLQSVRGASAPDRMRRAMLEPLTGGTGYSGGTWQAPDHPVLMGWVKRPLVPARVDGHAVREQAAYLFLVHLPLE
jgi:hypothetical protein